ncbi:MAG: transposase [Anaerolineales bacterium]
MKRKPCPSDLTNEQWARLAPHLPQAQVRGAPRRVNLREIIDALLYLSRTSCQWRMLPHDLPPWETVYAWADEMRLDLIRIVVTKAYHFCSAFFEAMSTCALRESQLEWDHSNSGGEAWINLPKTRPTKAPPES